MTSEQETTRRERYRRRTTEEIKAAAMDQLHEGGTEAVSLNAIARTMAMSTPALYRYFASRDELLDELAADLHLALADTLRTAATRATTPASRVRAAANAYRDWALSRPHAYRMTFEPTRCAHPASATITAAAQRSMNVFLAVVAEAGKPLATPAGLPHFGLVWWSRLHGLISLELGQHLAGTGVDATRLYQAEIETMLNTLRPTPA